MRKSLKKLCAAVTALSLSLSLSLVVMGSSAASSSAAQKFQDVAPGDTCYEDVMAANKYGLMAGVSDTQFDTASAVNRAMWTTMLRKMAGNPEVEGRSAFTDVDASRWYAPAATWAVDNGVVTGYPDGSFGVNNNVTRQELAVMAAMFAKNFKGVDTASEASLSAYADAADVAAWAEPAMKWAVGSGVLKPVSGKLAPKDTISRAEIAGVAVRLYELGGVDADTITALDIDWTQAAQLPLTGWFVKNFEGGRTATVYISEEASTRTYITVVAVPDGVDTQKFLTDEGWVALADQKGEALFALEPGAGGWGSVEEEDAYVQAAVGFLKSGANAKGVGLFSTYGEFYLAGYGAGAPALEAWSAANPIFVISQAYLDGESAGADTLKARAEAVKYDGVVSGNGYAPITNLDEVIGQVGIAGTITAADVPVPTWFVNYAADDGSIAYWKTANDAADTAQDGVYYQDIESDAYQTYYANQQARKAGAKHGISQVKVSEGDPSAADLYAFLSAYTRYDNSLAYSNALNYRLDYTAARVKAQQQAKAGKVLRTLSDGTEVWGQSDVKIAGHGTVQIGIVAFADNNGDGRNDPREYLVYIPEGFEGKELPIMHVYAGNTQSDVIFFDCTSWAQVAEEKGVVLTFICESYNAPTAITHLNPAEFLASINTVLAEEIDGKYADLDFTRIYASGQSMGSMYIQDIARSNPENFAAVATTSGIVASDTPIAAAPGSGKMVPAAMICGQGDNMTMVPDLWGSAQSSEWAEYLLEVNGAGGLKDYDKLDELVEGRTNVYTWQNEAGIPVFMWGQTLLRPHNCYPTDMWILWDFAEHYRLAEDGTRFYSASAFAEDDAVAIN